MNDLLKTKRLIVRLFDLEDAAFMLTLANTPAWLQFIGDRGIRTLEDAQNYLLNGQLKSYAEHGYGGWLVALKESGAPVGMCGLFQRNYLSYPDLGFAFLPEHAGQGYAYEAAIATLAYIKQQFSFDKLYAITLAENSRSIRLLEKCNFVFTSIIQPPQEGTEVRLYTLELAQ